MDIQANWRQPTPQENKSLTGCPNCRCISQEKINVKRPARKIRTTFAKPHFSLLAHKNVTFKDTILLSEKKNHGSNIGSENVKLLFSFTISVHFQRLLSGIYHSVHLEWACTRLKQRWLLPRVRFVWKASLLVSFNTSGTNTAVWMQ